MSENKLPWISVNDEKVEIPFSKVCVFDGANTFWAQLQKIEITVTGRKLTWMIDKPADFESWEPTHWLKITHPLD